MCVHVRNVSQSLQGWQSLWRGAWHNSVYAAAHSFSNAALVNFIGSHNSSVRYYLMLKHALVHRALMQLRKLSKISCLDRFLNLNSKSWMLTLPECSIRVFI